MSDHSYTTELFRYLFVKWKRTKSQESFIMCTVRLLSEIELDCGAWFAECTHARPTETCESTGPLEKPKTLNSLCSERKNVLFCTKDLSFVLLMCIEQRFLSTSVDRIQVERCGQQMYQRSFPASPPLLLQPWRECYHRGWCLETEQWSVPRERYDGSPLLFFHFKNSECASLYWNEGLYVCKCYVWLGFSVNVLFNIWQHWIPRRWIYLGNQWLLTFVLFFAFTNHNPIPGDLFDDDATS